MTTADDGANRHGTGPIKSIDPLTSFPNTVMKKDVVTCLTVSFVFTSSMHDIPLDKTHLGGLHCNVKENG